MATTRLRLVNDKGGVRSVTPESWKKLPKGKDGTYNGWRLQDGEYIASPIKSATVSSGRTGSAQPPFIPEEVRQMRDAEMKAKDEEIAQLKALVEAGKKEADKISGVGEDGTVQVGKVDEAKVPEIKASDLAKKPNEKVTGLNPDGTAKSTKAK